MFGATHMTYASWVTLSQAGAPSLVCVAGGIVGAENGEKRCEIPVFTAPLPILRSASPLVNLPFAPTATQTVPSLSPGLFLTCQDVILYPPIPVVVFLVEFSAACTPYKMQKRTHQGDHAIVA